MKNAIIIRTIMALAAFALALPVLGSQKHPVERPIKGDAHMVIVVNLSDGSTVSPNWGECTLIGRFTNEGHGFMNLATGLLMSGYGTAVAANGDQINWVLDGPFKAVIHGGTGRFEYATGWFSWLPVGDIQVSYDSEEAPTTMTMVFDYIMDGAISY